MYDRNCNIFFKRPNINFIDNLINYAHSIQIKSVSKMYFFLVSGATNETNIEYIGLKRYIKYK